MKSGELVIVQGTLNSTKYKMNILVTGASGMIGKALCKSLRQAGHCVTGVVRRSPAPGGLEVPNIDGNTDWHNILPDSLEVVVHLAARVHNMHESEESATKDYFEINTAGTLNLAKQCAIQRIKRFIFISTVKVLGEGKDTPYSAADPGSPIGAYAISKWEAEQGLAEIANNSEMEIVILRPTLVYGPDVRANFLSLMKAVDRNFVLPLGCIKNLRSLLYVGNMVDAICACVNNPNAVGKTYLLSDGENVSTPELFRRIAKALDRPPRLLPVPIGVLRFCGILLGKSTVVNRLIGSFVVESNEIHNDLGWSPPYSMAAGLKVTADWYAQQKNADTTV